MRTNQAVDSVQSSVSSPVMSLAFNETGGKLLIGQENGNYSILQA